ncbi:P-loop NTPase fold protein [Haloplasma contractile]|uniref:KAP domain containing protein n=1 Tax=Haloplasma contractile SSD-17B TaxID=1033810 RepID=U2DZA0_9MOLU|nr:P-loop NTPase fold protein [Haloplasma contractile]ERJ13537.1 KAP domain containing protein [Haloplasma contractile SSD-17B]
MNLQTFDTRCQNVEDTLDHNFKVTQIREYVRRNINISSHNVVALNGDAGSGKSSLLGTLFKVLDKEFFTLKFNVWKYENENTLSLSLLHYFLSRTESMFKHSSSDDLSKVLKLMGEYILTEKSDLTNLFKNYENELFYIDYNYNKISINIYKDHIKVIEFKENHVRKQETIDSRFKLREVFEYLFSLYLDLIIKRENNVIIIIDELDTYQASKILEFISNINHLFANNSKLFFIIGIDEESLIQTITKEFDNKHQAKLYLERLFSFTFNMPKGDSSKKIVRKFFGNNCELIADFFDVINFTNPRKVLKVIKRYYSLVEIKTNTTLSKDIRSLIPDVIMNENSFKETKHKQTWNTIIVLYFIILYDFYGQEYDDFKNYYGRFVEYVNFLNKNNRVQNKNNYSQLRIDHLHEKTLADIFAFEKKKSNNYGSTTYLSPTYNHFLASKTSSDYKPLALMYLFMPRLEKIIDIYNPKYTQKSSELNMNINPSDFIKISFDFEKNIQYRFTRFLLSNIGEDAIMKMDAEYHFTFLFDMIEKLC